MRGMNKCLWMYNLHSEKGKKIKILCLKQKIRIREIEPQQYGIPLGELAEKRRGSEISENVSDSFSDEMLVFQGFEPEELREFLNGFSRDGIGRVDLKAVLTPDNWTWTSCELYDALKQEHEALH